MATSTVQLLHMVFTFPKISVKKFPKLAIDKLRNIPKKKLRLALYISFGVICAIWIVYGVNQYWHNSYTKLLSQNAAILTETSADIKNLDQPITITPSRTSTTLPALVTSYQTLVKQINQTNLGNTNLFITGFYGLGDVKALNDASNARLVSTEAILTDTIDGLTAVRKFIEYDPATDLQPYVNGEETDASERLSRTQEGIKQVIADVKKASLPYSNDVAALLTPLAKEATNVTPATAKAWEEQVLKAQQAILKLVQDNQESALNTSANKLDELAAEYLALKQ